MDNLEFDKRIREIIEAHTEEPSVNSWDLIVSDLQRRRDARIRRIRRSIYVYSAAAAVLVFMIINPWIFSNRYDITVKESILSDNLFKKSVPEISIIEEMKRPTSFAENRIAATVKEERQADVVENRREQEQLTVEKEEQPQAVLNQKEAEKDNLNKVSENRPDNRVVRNSLSDMLFDNMSDKNIGGKPILALSTGVSPSYSGSYIPPQMKADSYDGSNNVNPVFLSAEAPRELVFHNEEYMMPVTIGVQILFPITDRLSVGTGVNYSMLSTKYYVTSQSTNSTEHRRVTVHYGGVPLTFQYKIYMSNKFKFYAFGGTVIEKGLAAIDKNLFDGSSIDERDEIKGVQLSVAAGLGVEYSILNSMGLYFDPNVTYYFDNRKKPQPFSIRTVQPLLFQFEAGLRFSL